MQYQTNVMGLENEIFRKLVFGAAVGQPRTPDYATVISPVTESTRKRASEQESEETLGSESTLSSDDEIFQPNKLGGVAVDFEEYYFADNELELSSIQRNGNISYSPFMEARHNKDHDTPDTASHMKVLFKDPPGQVLGDETELHHTTMPTSGTSMLKNSMTKLFHLHCIL
jgi:hypothetical protein